MAPLERRPNLSLGGEITLERGRARAELRFIDPYGYGALVTDGCWRRDGYRSITI